MISYLMNLPFWAWLCYAVIVFTLYQGISAALKRHKRNQISYRMCKEALQWIRPYYARITILDANVQWSHLDSALPPIKGYKFYGEILTLGLIIGAIVLQATYLILPATIVSIFTMVLNLGGLCRQDSSALQMFSLEDPSTRDMPRLSAFQTMACSHVLHLYAYHTKSTILGDSLDNPQAYLQAIEETMKKTIRALKAEAKTPLYLYTSEVKWLIKLLCDCLTIVQHNITIEQLEDDDGYHRFSELSLALCKQCLNENTSSSN